MAASMSTCRIDPIPGFETAIALVSIYPNQPCKATPTYMLVLQEYRSEISTVAHEFMHMIQRAYNPATECFDSWWMESTADWAMDYFDNMDTQADEQLEQRVRPILSGVVTGVG